MHSGRQRTLDGVGVLYNSVRLDSGHSAVAFVGQSIMMVVNVGASLPHSKALAL